MKQIELTPEESRELLSQAGNAIGLNLDFDYAERDGGVYLGPRIVSCFRNGIVGMMYSYWDPINIDGDAFTLSQSLGLSIIIVDGMVHVGRYYADVQGLTTHSALMSKDNTRICIVKAAAEIGRQLTQLTQY